MNIMLGLFNLGGGEIILILAIILILFGAKKLPELAKGLGQGIKEFKKATQNASEGLREAMAESRNQRTASEFKANESEGKSTGSSSTELASHARHDTDAP
jgi:sec-independent protein translocase protein TatA